MDVVPFTPGPSSHLSGSGGWSNTQTHLESRTGQDEHTEALRTGGAARLGSQARSNVARVDEPSDFPAASRSSGALVK